LLIFRANIIKLGNFDNFSRKNHVSLKFGHFVNFSYIFFGEKCRAALKLTELLRLYALYRTQFTYKCLMRVLLQLAKYIIQACNCEFVILGLFMHKFNNQSSLVLWPLTLTTDLSCCEHFQCMSHI